MPARVLVLAIAALLSVATSAPPYRYPRGYPYWRVTSGETRDHGCASASAWVSKSGKQGFGVTLRVANPSAAPCRVAVARARVELGAGEIPVAQLPGAIEVAPGGAPAHLYLPFAFDNEAFWNRDQRTAHLVLELVVDDQPGPAWSLPLHHERGPEHRKIPNFGRPGPPAERL